MRDPSRKSHLHLRVKSCKGKYFAQEEQKAPPERPDLALGAMYTHKLSPLRDNSRVCRARSRTRPRLPEILPAIATIERLSPAGRSYSLSPRPAVTGQQNSRSVASKWNVTGD